MPKFGTKEYLSKAKSKAKKIGADVQFSKVKNKKLSVFQDGKKVADIGDSRYSDYIQHNDPERRKNYKARHSKYRNRVGTKSYYADRILW